MEKLGPPPESCIQIFSYLVMTNVPVKCREDGGPRRQALGRARAQERAVRTAMQEVQRVQREMTHKMGEMRGVAISNAAERERCTCSARARCECGGSSCAHTSSMEPASIW